MAFAESQKTVSTFIFKLKKYLRMNQIFVKPPEVQFWAIFSEFHSSPELLGLFKKNWAPLLFLVYDENHANKWWANSETLRWEQMDGQMNRWTNRWTDRRDYKQLDEQMNGWTSRGTDGQTDEQMDKQMNRWTSRWTDRRTDEQNQIHRTFSSATVSNK